MSLPPIKADRKRKRPENDCSLCCVKRSRCEQGLEPSDTSISRPVYAATDAHLLGESALHGNTFDLHSTSPFHLTDFVHDSARDELCEVCSTSDRDSPAYTELATFETDTPGTAYSGSSSLSIEKRHSPSDTIGPDHSIISTSKIRESQQAFTIYASASISQRKYKGPSSLQAFAQWFHANSHILDKDLSEHFRHGLHRSEELDIPPSLSMPALCPEWEDYVDAYFEEIAPLFPVIRRETTIRAATYLSRFGVLERNPVSDRPTMACVYACVALGARSKGRPGVARAYIEAACSLSGYLTSLPYLESAQALILIAIEHRGREKNGAAFLAVRQAITILNSMGLHRTPSYGNDHLSVAHQQTDRRVWWTAYALEKTIALEDGRPSSTHDCSIDREVSTNGSTMHHLSAWKSFVDLARIQSQISEGFYDQSAWRDTSNFGAMLDMQDRLHEALAQWSDTLPTSLKPYRDSVTTCSDLLATQTFLSFQFHHTLIALHRAALTEDAIPDGTITETSEQTSRHARGLPRSELICANSARELLRSCLHYIKHGHSSPLVTLNQPLLAVYTLTIYALKYPNVSTIPQDLDLLLSATYAIEKGYQRIGMPAGFSRILSTLRDSIMPGSETASIPVDVCDTRFTCEKPQPVKEFFNTSEPTTTHLNSILGPGASMTSKSLGRNNPLWSEDCINLSEMDDIWVGTWMEAPRDH
ncbi:hypothetical protein QM012_002123 [Aureobasidium pullulans]|uniref:Xylanolytic transcriptional activator regulatory domain-containing protein n=1 Tax=Aureobasidium pullulans TaxID=5580 RepID=A0ABR0TB13_AURPU